ncbi:MAG: hypothetical protein WCA29_12125 [Jiangellales bacterium]
MSTDDGYRPDAQTDGASEVRHQALVNLHGIAGSLNGVRPEDVPGLRPASPSSILVNVAEAPLDEIPVSARVGVLFNLAKADFPHFADHEQEYRTLLASVADARDLTVDQLLSDLKEAAAGDTPFHGTASGQSMPHHETAFVGEDVCTTRTVSVGALTATWVFSEFETDAPFENVAGWIDPHSWPQRGPMMFKQMGVVGGMAPTPIGGLGADHWHGVFHEEVQLVRRLNTLLHCDYWRDGDRAAGMTYDLDVSLDSQIDVDRGFLLVVDSGPVRRVKALKIVGFTADIWDDVARLVCPIWTDFVRAAVEGGTSSTPGTPTSGPADAPAGTSTGDWLNEWLEFFGASSRTYVEMVSDVASRATSGGYQASDWVDDARQYWAQLAKDWSQAWTYGLESWEEVASQGMDAGFPPPGRPRETARGMAASMADMAGATASGAPLPAAAGGLRAESTIVPLPGLAAGSSPRVSRLESIEAGGATIEAAGIAVTVVALPDGTPGVRVSTTDPVVPAGLYVGMIESADQQPLVPVHLYVSRAEAPTQ